MIIQYAWRLVARNRRRTGTYLFGLALAVGLLSGILFFVDATGREMTATALAPVRLDIIAHGVEPTFDPTTAVAAVAAQRGVIGVEPVTTADFSSAVKVGGTQPSPVGRMFALQSSYFDTFDVLQISSGQFAPDSVMVSEAMAIVQKLKVGDSLKVTFDGVDAPVTLPVSGIINMDSADPLFALTNNAENAIVADVVVVDAAWFAANLAAPLAVRAANLADAPPPGSVVLDPQLHVKIDRTLLPADPTLAAQHTDSMRRTVERQFSGQLKAVDNLSATFLTAKADILSAKILFIFLGLPGVALAAYLAKFAAELFATAQRRELSLLRTRGATPRQITLIIAVASVLLAIGGSILGIAFGLLALLVSAGGQMASELNPLAQGFDWRLFGSSVAIAFVAGLMLTFLAAFLPSYGALRREIIQERRSTRRVETAPFWKRSYLDIMLLLAAAVILVVLQLNGGFKPTSNEGAAVQLSFYLFLAPFFVWIGLILLTLRLVESGLVKAGPQIARGFKTAFGEIGEVAGKSVVRRAPRVSAATAVIALTLSFGVSLAIFQQTYSTEKQLDAQYIVGSDIRFTPALNTPQAAEFAGQLMAPGVLGVTGVVRDTQALVGSEKNTVYGIDVQSFEQVAYLPDSFFVDGAAQQTIDAMANRNANYAPGSARTALDALAATPNGVLISVEQAEKYNILVGDPVLLHLYNRVTNSYTDVQAQAVGLFVYFPTSAQDSDFILNREFMVGSSGNPAMDFFLIRTDGSPETITRVAEDLAAQYKNVMPVRLQNTETVVKIESSSLTSLNLEGLGAMERLYTLLVTSVGLAIFLLAMIAERQREFGAMRALGANLSQLRRFLLAEAATIGSLSIVIGYAVGIGLAQLLVMLLGVIFTIPARELAFPGIELVTLGVLVVAGMSASAWISARRLAQLRVVEALREM